MGERLKIEGNFLIIFEDGNSSNEYINSQRSKVTPKYDESDNVRFYINDTLIGDEIVQFNCNTIIDDRTGLAFNTVPNLKVFLSVNLGVQSGGALNIKPSYDTKYTISNIDELIAIHPPNASDEIELGNNIYEIDSLDFEIPAPYSLISNVDTAISGMSQVINKLRSSQDNHSLITSTANLFFYQIQLQADGVNSEAITMNGATGFESLDMKYVEFTGNTKYGTLTGIRQGYWSDGFSLNAKEGFTMNGTWAGGFTIANSRIINTGNYILGEGTSLIMNSIRSNVNCDILTGDVAFDFDYNNFNSDEAYQLENGRYNGAGLMISQFTDALRDTDDPWRSRKSLFKGNAGSLSNNTHVGGYWKCTVEVLTPLTLNVSTKVLGTTVYSELQHITQTTDNAFIHNTTQDTDYEISGFVRFKGGADDEIELEIRKWDDFGGSYSVIQSYVKFVSNLIGGNDTVDFSAATPFVRLSENDRVELWVVNRSNNTDVTMLSDSFLNIKAK